MESLITLLIVVLLIPCVFVGIKRTYGTVKKAITAFFDWIDEKLEGKGGKKAE